MTTLIVETGAGLPDANSYASVAEADAYCASHPYAAAWAQYTQAEKTAALIWATRVLDDYVTWKGVRATTTQALRWPRVGVPDRDAEGLSPWLLATSPVFLGVFLPSTSIPPFLKTATAELARLLRLSDRTAEPDSLGVSQVSAGALSVTFDPADRREVIPESVAVMVAPYGTVRQRRTVRSAMVLRR